MYNNSDTEKEKPISPTTIRITAPVKERLNEAFKEFKAHGFNQSDAINAILDDYYNAQASSADNTGLMDDVLSHTAAVVNITRVLLDKLENAKIEAQQAVQMQMDSKDRSIISLQKRESELTAQIEALEAKIAELKPIAAGAEASRQAAIDAQDKAAKAEQDAASLKHSLTGTIADQAKQLELLRTQVENLPSLQKEKADLEREIDRQKQEIERLETESFVARAKADNLQKDLDQAREDALKAREHAIIDREKAAAEAREQVRKEESAYWQQQMDKAQDKADGLRNQLAEAKIALNDKDRLIEQLQKQLESMTEQENQSEFTQEQMF